MVFGRRSASFDGEVAVEFDQSKLLKLTQAQFESVLAKFEIYSQQAPIYSAVQISGQRAYKMARKAEIKAPEMPFRDVKILKWEIISFSKFQVKIQITCSKGFYVRSLVNDLAIATQTWAMLENLERNEIGTEFNLKNSVSPNQILNCANHADLQSVEL